MKIELVKDDNKFRLVINDTRIKNDQSLTIDKIIQMIEEQQIVEDLILEVE